MACSSRPSVVLTLVGALFAALAVLMAFAAFATRDDPAGTASVTLSVTLTPARQPSTSADGR